MALAVMAMKAVTLNHRRLDLFTAKDVLEGTRDRSGAGAAGAGNGDDGVTGLTCEALLKFKNG
jgi:hypothetical protein